MLLSKTFRDIATYTCIGLAVEFLLIALAIAVFNGTYDLWTNALVGLAGLYAFRLANWLIRLAIVSVTYLFTKRSRIEAVTALMYANKLPLLVGNELQDGMANLQEIASDETVNPTARKFALLSIGELNGLRVAGMWLAAIQASAVIDAAFTRYRAEHNARRSPQQAGLAEAATV